MVQDRSLLVMPVGGVEYPGGSQCDVQDPDLSPSPQTLRRCPWGGDWVGPRERDG